MATETEEEGLIQLWPPEPSSQETRLDIVAIHGLGGHPIKTWTDGKHMWLRDFLPLSIPDARIFSFGYSSGIAFNKSMSNINDFGRDVLESLRSVRRKKSNNRPLIFICHSLGGIVAKKALVIANERQTRYGDLLKSVRGIMFFGTPHRGADIAFWGKVMGKMASIITSVKTDLLDDLQTKSTVLGEICSQFVERGAGFPIFTYFERKKTSGINDLVVREDSAILHLPNETPMPMEATHQELCKFLTASSSRYKLVLDHLLELIELAGEEGQTTDSHLTILQQQLLQKLQVLDTSTTYHEIDEPYEGTCHWIVNTPEFSKLAHSTSSHLMWIFGIAGSGKSVLAKYLITQLQIGQIIPNCLNAFIFCGRIPRLTTSSDILQSLLAQILLASPSLFRYIDSWMVDRLNKGEKLQIRLLQEIIAKIVANLRGSQIWIIIDAIDELYIQEERSLLENVVQLLNIEISGRLKVIVTDRRLPPEVCAKDLNSRISLIDLDSKKVHEDVNNYISALVNRLGAQENIPHDMRDKIISSISYRSRGQFLLASLNWASFTQGVARWTPRTISKKFEDLEKFPAELESLYCVILDRIPSDFSHIVRQIFSWLLVAQEPIALSDLNFAISIQEGHRSLEAIRANLSFNLGQAIRNFAGAFLMIGSNEEVQFRHQTVRELLLCGQHNSELPEPLKFYRRSVKSCHYEVSKTCLTAMLLPGLQVWDLCKYVKQRERENYLMQLESTNGIDKLFESFPLILYTIKYWPYHFEECHEEEGTLFEVAVAFFQSPIFRIFRELRSVFVDKERAIGPKSFATFEARLPLLHGVIQLGDLKSVVVALIKAGADVNKLDQYHLSALHWAILRNARKTFYYLISRQDVDVNCGTEGHEKPLHTALNEVCADSIYLEALLSHTSIDVNLKGTQDRTALHLMVEKSDCYAKFVRQILQHQDIDVNAKDKENHTPLITALTSIRGREGALALLQLPSNKVDLSATDSNRTNAFALASLRGWTECLRVLLIQDGSQTYATNIDGLNALTAAAYFGQLKMVTTLLESYTVEQVQKANMSGRFNLANICAQQDWEDVLELLRTKFGIESQEQDLEGRTVLHWAALSGWSYSYTAHSEKQKAMLNVQDNHGCTPLHLAAEHRNIAATKFLLAEGANLFIKDKFGKTPAHVAAETGSRAVLELLLDTKVREFGRDHTGRGLLHFICMWEWPLVLQKYRIGRKLLVNIKDRQRQTPLHIAAIYGNLQMAKLLLQLGASLVSRDHIGFSPLHSAAKHRHFKLQDLFLRHGACEQSEDEFGRTALDLKNKVCTTKHLAKLRKLSTRFQLQYEWYDGSRRFVQRKNISLLGGLENTHFVEPYSTLPEKGPLILDQDYDEKDEEQLYLNKKERISNCKAEYINHELLAMRLVFENDKQDYGIVDENGWSLIHRAVSVGDLTTVLGLIAAGCDINPKNRYTGATPLHLAQYSLTRDTVEERDQIFTQVLLEAGADPTVTDNDGNTPVYSAIVMSRHANLERMLDCGKSFNQINRHGKTALHTAVRRRDIVAVKLLLGRCDPEVRDEKGNTAILIAMHCRGKFRAQASEYETIFTLLLDNGVDCAVVNSQGYSLFKPPTKGWWDITVSQQIEDSQNRRNLDPKELDCLIRRGQADNICIQQFRQRVVPHSYPTLVFSYSGNLTLLQWLLSKEPDLRIEVRSACSPWKGWQTPVTALHYAARMHTAKHLECLIQHGADVDQLNSYGETALMHAADRIGDEERTLEMIKTLLRFGAKTTIKTSMGPTAGWTAIDYAQHRGAHLVVQLIAAAWKLQQSDAELLSKAAVTPTRSIFNYEFK